MTLTPIEALSITSIGLGLVIIIAAILVACVWGDYNRNQW